MPLTSGAATTTRISHTDLQIRSPNMKEASEELTGDEEEGVGVGVGDGDDEEEEIPFSVGDLVWAKTKSYSWWPGHVYDPSLASDGINQARRPRHCALVAYFGDNDSCAWCEPNQLKPFAEEFHQMVHQYRQKSFMSAVAEAVDEIGEFLVKELACCCFPLPESREETEMENVRSRAVKLRMPVSNYSPRDFLQHLRNVARDVSIGDELESAMLGSWVFSIERVSFSADSIEYCQRLDPAELVDDDMDLDDPPAYLIEEERCTISKKLRISEDKVYQSRKRVSAARCIDSESFGRYRRSLCSKGSGFDACQGVLHSCSVTNGRSINKVLVDKTKGKRSAGKKTGDRSIEETMSGLDPATKPSNQGEKKTKVASIGVTSLGLHQTTTNRCEQGNRSNGNTKGKSGLDRVTNPFNGGERKTNGASVVETSLGLHQTSFDHCEQGKHWPVRTTRKNGNTKGTFSVLVSDGTTRSKIVKTGLKRKIRKAGSTIKPLVHLNVQTRDKFEIGKFSTKKRKVKGGANGMLADCSEESQLGRKKSISDEDCSGTLDNVGCETRYPKEAGETSQTTEYKDASTSRDMAALLLTFDHDISLPSMDNLISTFSEYGHLIEVETLSVDKIGCARVLFTSSSDAEKAFNSRHNISAFGPAVRSYHLCR